MTHKTQYCLQSTVKRNTVYNNLIPSFKAYSTDVCKHCRPHDEDAIAPVRRRDLTIYLSARLRRCHLKVKTAALTT